MKTRSAEPEGAPGATKPLGAGFYVRPVLDVAADLIGCTVVHGTTAGVIVETEAYHQQEPACHAYVGLTPRTSTLFGAPGVAYVYRSYGIHALLNAVCEPEGVGAAVLIRALRPLEGVELMRERRGGAGRGAERELCSGPGRLTQALGIELTENGSSLESGPVLIMPREGPAPQIVSSARIGITKAAELPWRFSVAGEENVSKPWPRRGEQPRGLRRGTPSRSG
ncbi:MAG: DNA-3-methyladenine glycosylase [Solirubrobacteraceae bacterium]|nr:DNA-3-methyladenine glycosylase [Solirubrobacteraceae bacterium]